MQAIGGKKKYVSANVIHYPNGQCCPTVIEVDQKPYVIQRILEVRPVPKAYQLDASEYYVVEVNGRECILFREEQQWFVIPGLVRRSDGKKQGKNS